MCIPSVPDWHNECQAPDDGDPIATYRDERDRIPGWDPFLNRATRRRQEREDARARVPSLPTPGLGTDLPDNVPVTRHKSPKIGRPERRVTRRADLVLLDDNSRMMARHLLAAAARCRSKWMELHRTIVSEAGDVDERMACRKRCKTRGCEECEDARRKRQCARVAGEYGLFFTLTLPQSHQTGSEAWQGAHGCVAVFVRELRREVAYGRDEKPRKTARGEAAREERKARSLERVDLAEKLEYAWVLEPHKVGYPHVHMCVNATFIAYSFMRELWARACGVMFARINGRRVWSVDGVCRYLSKYISKGGLTVDILAILYRRRLWACTYPAAKRPEAKWIQDKSNTSRDIEMMCQERATWGAQDGWSCAYGADGEYAVWARVSRPSQPVEVRSPLEVSAIAWRLGVELAGIGGAPIDRDEIKEIVKESVTSAAIWRVVWDDWIDRLKKTW